MNELTELQVIPRARLVVVESRDEIFRGQGIHHLDVGKLRDVMSTTGA